MKRIPKAAAYHEAAHAVARIHVGAAASAVEVRLSDKGLHGHQEPLVYRKDSQGFAWDFALVCLAGPYAEARVSWRMLTCILNTTGAHDDEASAHEHAWLEANGYAADYSAAWRRTRREMREFLHQRWPAIALVAEALQARGRLEAHEVTTLCEVAGEA
jgi:hypothetical protein